MYFAKVVLFPLAGHIYDYVDTYEYAQEKPAKVRDYINNIKNTPDWSYIFVADFDQGPCVTRRKDRLVSRYGNLDIERILIVRRLIESWYLAGLNQDSCAELGIRSPDDTSTISKEQFDDLVPSRFEDRVNFMVEVLNRYDIGAARQQNESFDYAMGKHFGAIA